MSLKKATAVALLALGATLFIGCSDDAAEDKLDAGPPDAKLDHKVADLAIPDMDPKKKPKITKMIPASGFSNGGKTGTGTPVLFQGENFSKPGTVYINGKPQANYPTINSNVSASFLMPANADDPNKPQRVQVMLYMDGQFSNSVNFQYTVTKAMTDDFKGSVVTKTSTSFADFDSKAIQGKVFYKGLTDTETTASKKLVVEIGYGKAGTDPSTQPGYKWFAATFVKQDSGYHVYEGKLKVPLVTTYDVAYRFSYDKDAVVFGEYVYADTDESDKVYSAKSAATITASKAPLRYCKSNDDCKLEQYYVVCKVNTSDDTKNKCQMCLKDADCKISKYTLGPYCDTTKMVCNCKADSDCAKKSLNGYKCIKSSVGSICGCSKDVNCPTGTKCNKGFCM